MSGQISTPYTLTLDLERAPGDALRIGSTIHAGTNTSSLAMAIATATSSGTSLAGGFDALAIGYRNRDAGSVSHLRVSQVSVQLIKSLVWASNPYEAFIVLNGLDPATTGSPTADPDSDNIANAMEFILGGNPRVANTSILPVLVVDSGWRFRFLRHVDFSSAFRLAVEQSADLTKSGVRMRANTSRRSTRSCGSSRPTRPTGAGSSAATRRANGAINRL